MVRLASRENRPIGRTMMKRVFDLVIATAGLVFLAPFLVLVALLIRLDSPGPALYFGRRIGRGGRLFRIIKFRTMHLNAEALGTTTRLHDPRITRVGRFLRQYKIDELPQLLNVVMGTMSLVGPRPEVEEHVEAYTDEEKIILSVKPGITDLASIRFVSLDKELGPGENAHEVFVTRLRTEKNRLRIKYVKNQCFFGDLKIITLTLFAIVRKIRKVAD